MKRFEAIHSPDAVAVTLRVRVWIETRVEASSLHGGRVTLRVRVWIETLLLSLRHQQQTVTLRVRVWIETR